MEKVNWQRCYAVRWKLDILFQLVLKNPKPSTLELRMRTKHLEITGMQGSSIHGVNSVIGSTRMDNSFVVLPKEKPQQQKPQGILPRPRAGGWSCPVGY